MSYFDNIKQYLSGKLSAEDKYAFELEMENDPFLKEAVEGFELLQADTKSFPQSETAITDAILVDSSKGKSVPLQTNDTIARKSSSSRLLAMAAVVVGIALVLWFLTQSNKQQTLNTDAIYAGYFKPLTHPDALVRGENSNASPAVEAYEKEDYFEAVNIYRKLVDVDSNNVKNKLFLGISYMSTNQPQKAIATLSTLLESQEYYHDIRWYLALAYLKTKQIDHAEKLFSQLAKEDNFYQEKAKEISDKLGTSLAQN